MNNNIFAQTIFIISLCSSITLARTPIGPPTADLNKGQWSIGLSTSKIDADFKLNDTKGTTFFTTDKLCDFEIKSFLGKLSYGITDDWEISVGFGTSDSEYQYFKTWMDGSDLKELLLDYESDKGFVAEVGTKATFYEKGPLGIGASLQVSWNNLDGEYSETLWTAGLFDNYATGDIEADILTFQFAPGISYEIFGGCNLFMGPLWEWTEGKGEADGTSGSLIGQTGEGDISQDSSFGGFIGFQPNTGSDMAFNFEWQSTGTSDKFAFSFISKF